MQVEESAGITSPVLCSVWTNGKPMLVSFCHCKVYHTFSVLSVLTFAEQPSVRALSIEAFISARDGAPAKTSSHDLDVAICQ